MMRNYPILGALAAMLLLGHSLDLAAQGRCQDEAFHNEVAAYLTGSVPAVDVDDLFNNYDEFVVLDAREKEEYEVSHLPGAVWVGYDNFDPKTMRGLPEETPIVIYCSIGYRSEKIGERLLNLGYRKTKNLYGSLFEWSNRGYMLHDTEENPTQKVHTYNRKWSRWVLHPQIEKVW